MDNDQMKKLIEALLVVFDLTSRSVPSNHHDTIKKQIKILEDLKKEIENGK
jgi:hypothetical protein